MYFILYSFLFILLITTVMTSQFFFLGGWNEGRRLYSRHRRQRRQVGVSRSSRANDKAMWRLYKFEVSHTNGQELFKGKR